MEFWQRAEGYVATDPQGHGHTEPSIGHKWTLVRVRVTLEVMHL